jgi:ferredoxin
MIEVQRGEKLRTALLRRGATPHNAGARLINCRGLGTCGTCAVEVDGTVEPANHTIAEKLRMNLPPHSGPRPGFRLACQVTVESDLVVRKRDKFWGQGEALAPERNDARVSWLGELEYSLDFTSPPPAPHVRRVEGRSWSRVRCARSAASSRRARRAAGPVRWSAALASTAIRGILTPCEHERGVAQTDER